MGANKLVKQRKCLTCEMVFFCDSETLWRHSRMCSEGAKQQERLAAIGLVSPEQPQRGALTIKKVED